MNVNEIMTSDVACCTPQETLDHVAQMMLQHDCGAIPVCEGSSGKQVIGIVTDRDIVCRAVAQGRDPSRTTARAVMTTPVATVTRDASVETCCRIMEEQQVRRIPVVEADGSCCGIVAQADIARNTRPEQTGEVVQMVSESSHARA